MSSRDRDPSRRTKKPKQPEGSNATKTVMRCRRLLEGYDRMVTTPLRRARVVRVEKAKPKQRPSSSVSPLLKATIGERVIAKQMDRTAEEQ